jgi:ABC-2 type transport system ATP-binding protein/lipopolysaccharide transport system ATP-binding protein
MTEFAIRADNLSKRFWLHSERRTGLKERFIRGPAPRAKEFWALRDASFEIERGTTFGLVGQNGSGKSTTLKVLAGIYRPTSGLVEVKGRVSALLELGAGFHGELTGRENIRLNGAILGLSGRQIDSAMGRIIDFAGLGEFIDSPVKVYSSGMYVRLGFAIAVSLDPEILMVDEIIAVGDEEFQRKCFDYLSDLRKRGSTIVLVSHSLGLVRDLCDQAAWLDHGHIRELGPAYSVVDDYIADVNAREVQAAQDEGAADGGSQARAEAPTPGPAPVEEHGVPRRAGSGEIRITGIDYLDGHGNPSPILFSGDPCTFRMRYASSKPIARAIFGIGFFNEAGVDVSGPNSRGVGPWRVEQGSGYVDLELKELLLQPSTYRISAAVVDRGHTFDLADREYELRVRGRGDDDPGVARMPGIWKPPVPIREPVSGKDSEEEIASAH